MPFGTHSLRKGWQEDKGRRTPKHRGDIQGKSGLCFCEVGRFSKMS